jgi:hypothetical protein
LGVAVAQRVAVAMWQWYIWTREPIAVILSGDIFKNGLFLSVSWRFYLFFIIKKWNSTPILHIKNTHFCEKYDKITYFHIKTPIFLPKNPYFLSKNPFSHQKHPFPYQKHPFSYQKTDFPMKNPIFLWKMAIFRRPVPLCDAFHFHTAGKNSFNWSDGFAAVF